MSESQPHLCQLPTSPSALPPTPPSLLSQFLPLCSLTFPHSCLSVPVLYLPFRFSHTDEATKKHTHSVSDVSLKCRHTLTQSVFLLFSPAFHPFPPLFSLILSQLYRCLMLSPCCRERTEHLSFSGGGDGGDGGGARAPRFALQQNTRSSGLEGRQSTGDQTLDLGPAAGFHNSLPPPPPDLGHFHVGQQQAAFLLVSNLLFVLASMLSMSREGCWGGNRGGETCRYQRYQQRLCALKVMFANQISED